MKILVGQRIKTKPLLYTIQVTNEMECVYERNYKLGNNSLQSDPQMNRECCSVISNKTKIYSRKQGFHCVMPIQDKYLQEMESL